MTVVRCALSCSSASHSDIVKRRSATKLALDCFGAQGSPQQVCNADAAVRDALWQTMP